MGQSKMDNPEKLATQMKKNKTKTQHDTCWTQTNTKNVDKTTRDEDEPNIVFMRKS